jgi:hypothetical protein
MDILEEKKTYIYIYIYIYWFSNLYEYIYKTYHIFLFLFFSNIQPIKITGNFAFKLIESETNYINTDWTWDVYFFQQEESEDTKRAKLQILLNQMDVYFLLVSDSMSINAKFPNWNWNKPFDFQMKFHKLHNQKVLFWMTLL